MYDSSIISTDLMELVFCFVFFPPQPGGDVAETQRGPDVGGAGDGRRERGVRDERRASRPHPGETDLPDV